MALTVADYNIHMTNIGFPIALADLPVRHREYLHYEELWEIYLKTIFLPNYDSSKKYVRIIFLESCPGGLPFPHSNYIFNNLPNVLHGKVDKYLQQIHRGAVGNLPSISKNDALINLSKENLLIVDLLPSHGFQLNSHINRLNVNMNIPRTCDLGKINDIILDFRAKGVSDIRIAFGMPPTVKYNDIATEIIGALTGFTPAVTNYGTITAGSGFPSFTLLERLIHRMGF